jgi:hypothetical protein
MIIPGCVAKNGYLGSKRVDCPDPESSLEVRLWTAY